MVFALLKYLLNENDEDGTYRGDSGNSKLPEERKCYTGGERGETQNHGSDPKEVSMLSLVRERFIFDVEVIPVEFQRLLDFVVSDLLALKEPGACYGCLYKEARWNWCRAELGHAWTFRLWSDPKLL